MKTDDTSQELGNNCVNSKPKKRKKPLGFTEWFNVDWKAIERRVYRLQKRIYRASSQGNVKVVRRLQKILMRSWSAKMLAVRRVTQDNQGKRTAGVDGVKSLTPNQRMKLVGKLKLTDKAAPTRRVWIPKPGKTEKRPLGIPIMHDRALQALAKLVLEPEWDAKFEPNSFGFRPGRSCHDAIEAIFLAIKHKSKYVLDADIAKCFDRINHSYLLEKLNTFPRLSRQIRAWLKSGVLDKKEWFPTDEGTPQGGVISPLLANIALHGMEERIKEYAESLPQKGLSRTNRRREVSLIRYADDFLILHESPEVIEGCTQVIKEWLAEVGLELKPSKTRTAHTLKQIGDEKPGFDFLGFNVRQHIVGKHHSGKNTHKKLLGFKTIIKPSKEKVQLHLKKLADIVDSHKAVPQAALIRHLNPVIRGWCNYYSTKVSSKTFATCNSLLYHKLRRWAKRRHPNKSGKWVAMKYWHSIDRNNWVFAVKTESGYMKLYNHADTPIVRHVKVKGEASPFDGNLKYWSSRMGEHPEMPKRKSILLKRQKGKCAYCGHTFREGDIMEEDHIIPKARGGKDVLNNLQLLHRHCHDRKTATDGSRKCA